MCVCRVCVDGYGGGGDDGGGGGGDGGGGGTYLSVRLVVCMAYESLIARGCVCVTWRQA